MGKLITFKGRPDLKVFQMNYKSITALVLIALIGGLYAYKKGAFEFENEEYATLVLPQLYLVPVSPKCSRNTQSKEVPWATLTSCEVPLIFSE
ncbi:hypothetical protein GCM10011412_13700 [Maribacter cobaltidurans]|nr:hypothetical protein GCM10011412_13700 [Maribacter cobaltidurans]